MLKEAISYIYDSFLSAYFSCESISFLKKILFLKSLNLCFAQVLMVYYREPDYLNQSQSCEDNLQPYLS